MRFLLVVFLSLWAVPVWAQPLKVVATNTILADLVRQIGGEDVDVVSLSGLDSDPHAYKPSAADLAKLNGAGLLVINGLGLEDWITEAVQSSGYKGQVLMVARDIEPRKFMVDGVSQVDPHAWQDVMAVRGYALAIELSLCSVDAAHTAQYRQRVAAYDRTLSVLNRWVKEQMASVPKAKRKVVTAHDGFSYFSEAYGVAFLSPRGLESEMVSNPDVLTELANRVKAEGIKAVFVENTTETKSIETIAHDAGVAVAGTLYADALSAAVPTYEAMMRHNVELLRDSMLK